MEIVTKSIRVDPDLWRQVRSKAVGEGMTMQDLITRLFLDYLKEGKKGGR